MFNMLPVQKSYVLFATENYNLNAWNDPIQYSDRVKLMSTTKNKLLNVRSSLLRNTCFHKLSISIYTLHNT